jgi:hypothetical protein
MSLLNTARALDDARFVWRVKAAALTIAADKISSTGGAGQAFASFILGAPMADNITMSALVAADAAVAATVTVDEFNTVSTEGVSDGDILAAVQAHWDTMAAQWAGQ